jgi:hypothetical protein
MQTDYKYEGIDKVAGEEKQTGAGEKRQTGFR